MGDAEVTDEYRVRVTGFPYPTEPEEEKTPETWLERLEVFVGTRIGGALLAFVMTAVLGSTVSVLVANYQAERTARLASAQREADQQAAAQAITGSYLEGRLTSLSMLTSALARELPDEVLNRRLEAYEESYRESKSGFATFSIQFAEIKKYKFSGENHFQTVLSEYIVPSFARLDACVIDAYQLRVSNRARLRRNDDRFPRISSSSTGSLICGAQHEGGLWDTRLEVNRLAGCIGTFNAVLRDRLRLLRFAREERARASFLLIFPPSHKLNRWEEAMDPGWDATEGKLLEGCAALASEQYVDREPLVDSTRSDEQDLGRTGNSWITAF